MTQLPIFRDPNTLNVKTFLTVSAFLPAMIARPSGKSGVIAFTRHLGGEFANEGIRVNCIAPSAIDNDHMGIADEKTML
jgi:NAD(P)-dependent dehydrogenase (short-subunit alcohol dehydrogenase family)